jgi:hypothetical protein
MTYSLFDVGACNCPATGCACYPCTLPASNLAVAMTIAGSSLSYPGTLVYAATCTWTGCVMINSSLSLKVQISLISGCTLLNIGQYPSGNCTGTRSQTEYWCNPSGCSVPGGLLLTLLSFSCSPLNIVWNYSMTSNFSITVTP